MIGNDFDELSNICAFSIKDQNLLKKTQLADLAISYLDFIKFKIELLEDSLTPEQTQGIIKLSSQLSEVAVTFKDQALKYSERMD